MTILQSLDRYYGRLAVRGDVVLPGYSVEPIGFVIALSPDGGIAAVEIRHDPSGKKPKPERVPRWFGRSGTGSTPYFLWDNTAYVLGVSAKDAGKTARDHAEFKAFHIRALADETDEGLSAFRGFLETWTSDRFIEPLFNEKLLAWNVAFRLDGELRLLHERPAAARHIERLRTSAASSGTIMCLITGTYGAPARLHPKIKGVDSPGLAEVPLVSFEKAAFKSYGQERGENAPTSEAAAFRYGAALNRLLDRTTSRNRLRIGDATVAFWADASNAKEEQAASAAEDFFARLVAADAGDATADDAGETRKLRDALTLVAAGRPIAELGLGLMPGTRFHVLGLAPNAGRLSVRFWLDDRFEVFASRLARHYQDLSITPSPWGARMPSVQRLLVRTTALMEKFDNIPPLVAGEVMRAVLSGTQYPRTLLIAAITRLRAGDDPGRGWHAAVIKAVINRSEKEHLPVGLDPDNPNQAYQLGRLFAVLEEAQRAALGAKVNATIADRYYGAASATPARIFGTLLRGLRNHVADARKRGRGGWIEPKVGEIIAKLPPDLARTLRLEDQGRFAVGYYHQRAERPTRSDEDAQPDQESNDE